MTFIPAAGSRVRILELQPGTRGQLEVGDVVTVESAQFGYGTEDRATWKEWAFVTTPMSSGDCRNGWCRVELVESA